MNYSFFSFRWWQPGEDRRYYVATVEPGMMRWALVSIILVLGWTGLHLTVTIFFFFLNVRSHFLDYNLILLNFWFGFVFLWNVSQLKPVKLEWVGLFLLPHWVLDLSNILTYWGTNLWLNIIMDRDRKKQVLYTSLYIQILHIQCIHPDIQPLNKNPD